MSEEKSDAVAVLPEMRAADDKLDPDLGDCLPTGKVCKNTAMLGIKGMEDPGMAAAQRSEWRRQMAEEGKAPLNARSIGEEFADKFKTAAQAQD
jgi:hypothetical protein